MPGRRHPDLEGVDLEEVREETRLQSPAKEVAPRPKEAFPKLADFLQQKTAARRTTSQPFTRKPSAWKSPSPKRSGL